MAVSIIVGDAVSKLKTLPSESVHCCISSPPYYGLRDYGVEGQIGLEPTPEAYVERMVSVFREVRRVLRNDGTLWLNIGDSYAGYHGNSRQPDEKAPSNKPGYIENMRQSTANRNGLKPKDLIGIPWMLAFALRADGWYLRRDIIWHKPNPMPESVTDRPTTAHEYVFLLTKSARYFYDSEAIKEENSKTSCTGGRYRNATSRKYSGIKGPSKSKIFSGEVAIPRNGRNKRSVWTIATAPFRGAHFATFPPALVEPCILAGTSERGVCPKCGAPWGRMTESAANIHPGSSHAHAEDKIKGTAQTRADGKPAGTVMRERHEAGRGSRTIGWRPTCSCNAAVAVPATVLDTFFGAGTTGLVADQLGRDCIGIELNPEYAEMAERRIAGERLKRFESTFVPQRSIFGPGYPLVPPSRQSTRLQPVRQGTAPESGLGG